MEIEEFVKTYNVSVDEAVRLNQQINALYGLIVCYDDKKHQFLGAVYSKETKKMIYFTRPYNDLLQAVNGINAFSKSFRLKPDYARSQEIHPHVLELLRPVTLAPAVVGRQCNPPVFYGFSREHN